MRDPATPCPCLRTMTAPFSTRFPKRSTRRAALCPRILTHRARLPRGGDVRRNEMAGLDRGVPGSRTVETCSGTAST